MDAVGGKMLIKALVGENVDIKLYDHIDLTPRLNIQRLDLSGCKTLTENDLCWIISCCPNLRSLNLRGLSAVGPKSIGFIWKIETLEEIDVSYCRALELPSLLSYIKRISEVQAKNLRSIRAAGLFFRSNMLLLSIIRRCHNLERLDLQGCHGLTDDMFENFHNYCIEDDKCLTSLTHLNVSNTPLTPAIFTYLNGHLPNLTHLEMANLSGADNPDDDDDGYELSKMLKSMPKLRKVDLEDTAGLSGVSDMVLEALTPMDGDVGTTGCELEELKIGYARVSSGAIVDLIKGCKKLRVLELDVSQDDPPFFGFLFGLVRLLLILSLIRIRKQTIQSCANFSAVRILVPGYPSSTAITSHRLLTLRLQLPPGLVRGGKDGQLCRLVMIKMWRWLRRRC